MVSRIRIIPVLAIVLVGCGRQHTRPAAQASPSVQGGQQPAGNPEPVAAPEAVSPAADTESARQFTLPAGTRIRVRLNQTLDAKYCRTGEAFTAQLGELLVIGRRVVAPSGSPIRGHVTEARQSGRLRGRAVLGLTLDSIQVDGSSYTVATYQAAQVSNSHKKRNAAAIGGAVGAGAGTAGAFFTGRKDVVLPVETELVFALRSPVTIRG